MKKVVSINSNEHNYKAKLHATLPEHGLTWFVIGDDGYQDQPDVQNAVAKMMDEVARQEVVHFVVNSGDNFNYEGISNNGKTNKKNNWTYKYLQYPTLNKMNWYGVKKKSKVCRKH